jgi:hypothetical protein
MIDRRSIIFDKGHALKRGQRMEVDTRKARVKSLKRILNSLSVEIKELRTRGLADTEDLDQAQISIARFCEKILPFPTGSVRHMHDYRLAHPHQQHHHNPPRRAAGA